MERHLEIFPAFVPTDIFSGECNPSSDVSMQSVRTVVDNTSSARDTTYLSEIGKSRLTLPRVIETGRAIAKEVEGYSTVRSVE